MRPPAPLAGPDGRPVVIGHRGAPGETPGRLENELASFDAAFQAGAEAIEFDVRIAADGVPVVAHDPDLRRTHGERLVIARTPARHLPVPTLEAVFSHLAEAWPERAVDVELKVPLAPDSLGEIMDRAGWRGATLVSSFLPRAVRAYARSGWTTAVLVETRRLTRQGAAAFLSNAEADVLGVRDPVFPRALREAAHEAGTWLWAFTLNRDASLKKAHRHRLDGIITDYPARALALYARLAAAPGGSGDVAAPPVTNRRGRGGRGGRGALGDK